MSALDFILMYEYRTPDIHEWSANYKPARAELAALRARVAELEEAHVYLDESPVNYPDDDKVYTLADRIAPIVGEIIEARKTIAELEDQIDQFRFLLVAHNASSARDLGCVIDALVKENAQQAAQLEQARDHFNAISKMPPHFTDATAISEAIVIARDWLSSNPVSQSEEH